MIQIWCEKCQYFEKLSNYDGVCYLNPPIRVEVVDFRGDKAVDWDRPRVATDDFCSHATPASCEEPKSTA